jgi:pimeloyl-ACP methyl ester carboxylesterase
VSTWVLLRGLVREARHWGDFPQRLARRLPAGDTVCSLDLPGNGGLWREASPASVSGMVAAARAQLPPRQGRVLVALSLGGMVALDWAANAPGEVEGCVLINSSLGRFSPFWQRLRTGSLPALARWTLPGPAAARERAIYRITSNRAPNEAVIADWARHAGSAPVSAANAARQLWAAARFRAPAAPKVPVLVLCSRGDRLVSPRCSHAIARAWDLPLREHPDAGHDLPLDAPDWVIEQIVQWWPRRFEPAA